MPERSRTHKHRWDLEKHQQRGKERGTVRLEWREKLCVESAPVRALREKV